MKDTDTLSKQKVNNVEMN